MVLCDVIISCIRMEPYIPLIKTDIDIFLTTSGSLPSLRVALQKMNISDDIRFPGNYLEILISETEKIQFFETRPRMPQNRILTSLWNFNDVYIEGIEEILVKIIYYRAHKGNTRDIFDIAVGLSKNPHFFEECLFLIQISGLILHKPVFFFEIQVLVPPVFVQYTLLDGR